MNPANKPELGVTSPRELNFYTVDGVATSSSPFHRHSQGGEDIAAPKPFQKGGSVNGGPRALGRQK
jgi:hypothetical protein